ESVHHFYKYVSGNVLTRPAWFFDVGQEGEGIVDVTTHLVDLIQWACFPEQIIDYKTDIELISANRWSPDLSLDQFAAITKLQEFPSYLDKDVVNEQTLKVFANGEINYKLKGIHAKVSVKWAYQPPEGAGDTHYSIMRGSKANLVIRQGEEQNYIPTLYVEPLDENTGSQYETALQQAIDEITEEYPGVSLSSSPNGWQVDIPEEHRVGHE